MDSPNNGPGDGSSGSRGQQPANQAEYTRHVRQAMDDRRRTVLQKLNHFRPHVHDQMNRLFGSYEAPLYARLRGFTSARTMALTESSITALAAGSDRSFEDPEAQALGEYIITGLNRNIVFKWALTVGAGIMTWRGRKTFRLPFITPAGGGLLCPYKGGQGTKGAWHAMRFVAYNIFGWVAIEPVFQIVNMMNQKSAMVSDPRLRNVMKDSQAKQQPVAFGQEQGQGQGQAQDGNSSWGQESQADYSQQPQQSYSTEQTYSRPSQEQEQPQQSSWTSYSQQPNTYQPQQPQQQTDAWGSSSVDDFDDASPVAGQNAANQGGSGSAWDRVRQQSQPSQQRQQPRYQQQQQPQQWGQQQQQSNEWGNVDDASPQRRPASESYTYSAADGERAEAKSQAQKEFDALLERERYGEGRERGGWSKK